ncbi:MAG: hypothetical protein ABI586_08135 [Candidatus Nanopelagicales bacterium]
MTTSRKWSLGTALVVVLILVATWFLLVSPKRGDAAALATETESQLNTNADLALKAALLEQENKKLPKYQAELAAYRERVPQSNSMPGYIRQLTAAAKQSGVFINSITPSKALPLSLDGAPPAALPPEGVLPGGVLAGIDVSLVVYGGFYELQQFSNKLENLQRYTLVTSLSIVEPDEGELDKLPADALDDPSKALTATYGNRIYLLPSTPEAVAPTTAAPQS